MLKLNCHLFKGVTDLSPPMRIFHLQVSMNYHTVDRGIDIDSYGRIYCHTANKYCSV